MNLCVFLPTVYSLLGQLFVEIGGVRGERGSFLDPTQPNVGSAISAQDHLQNTGNGVQRTNALKQCQIGVCNDKLAPNYHFALTGI